MTGNDPATLVGTIVLGLLAGVVGGMFGIGGGLIMVPALILIFGFGQKMATGTSLLAQLLPVGLLAVREFWRREQVAVVPGLLLAAGLFVGTLIGARLTFQVSPARMKQLYGAFLVAVGIYFLLAPQGVKERPVAEPPATGRAAS